jgi:hypothetical protein
MIAFSFCLLFATVAIIFPVGGFGSPPASSLGRVIVGGKVRAQWQDYLCSEIRQQCHHLLEFANHLRSYELSANPSLMRRDFLSYLPLGHRTNWQIHARIYYDSAPTHPDCTGTTSACLEVNTTRQSPIIAYLYEWGNCRSSYHPPRHGLNYRPRTSYLRLDDPRIQSCRWPLVATPRSTEIPNGPSGARSISTRYYGCGSSNCSCSSSTTAHERSRRIRWLPS